MTIANALTVGFLVFLEAVLSVDNALVLAIFASKLPEKDRKKALTWGMWGAMIFRFLALGVMSFIIQSNLFRVVGASYLLWLAGKHFFGRAESELEGTNQNASVSFWKTIVLIELLDISFSLDSIVASIGVTRDFWVVFIGGVAGIATMRFVSVKFIKLIEKYPNLERTAFLLVAVIGTKLLLEAAGLDFETELLARIGLWITMLGCVISGFIQKPVDPQKQPI